MSEVDNEEVQKQHAVAEKEARLLGWVPKEEFRDGDHWVDAEAFVKRGKEINPILRKNNETLLKKLEERDVEIAEVKKVAKEFEKFQKENAEKKVKELQAELIALKEQKKEAVSKGDGGAVVAIDDAIDAVKEEQAAAKVEPKVEPKKDEPKPYDPILIAWMDKNEWFTVNSKLTRMADALGASINDDFPELRGKAFLDKLDEELAINFPDKFPGKRITPVESGTNRNSGTRSNSKKHTFENLPPDAKAAADRFIKQGMIKDRDSYVAEYDWSDE